MVKIGYLICKKCGGYYELQQGESPDEFEVCQCSGKLEYVERLDNVVEGSKSQEDIQICSKCGFKNYNTSKFCSGCGIRLKSIGSHNKNNSTRNQQSSGVKSLTIIIIFVVFCFVFGSAILVAGYYNLAHTPYQSELSNTSYLGGLSKVKQMQLDEVNRFFKGPLANDSIAVSLRAKINNAKTLKEIPIIDIINASTKPWRKYQNQQIDAKKNSSGKVKLTFTNGDSTIMKVADAHKFVNVRYANALSNMEVTTP